MDAYQTYTPTTHKHPHFNPRASCRYQGLVLNTHTHTYNYNPSLWQHTDHSHTSILTLNRARHAGTRVWSCQRLAHTR